MDSDSSRAKGGLVVIVVQDGDEQVGGAIEQPDVLSQQQQLQDGGEKASRSMTIPDLTVTTPGTSTTGQGDTKDQRCDGETRQEPTQGGQKKVRRDGDRDERGAEKATQ